MDWIWWTRNQNMRNLINVWLPTLHCSCFHKPTIEWHCRPCEYVFPSTCWYILLLSYILNNFILKRREQLSLIRQQCVFLSLLSLLTLAIINHTWSLCLCVWCQKLEYWLISCGLLSYLACNIYQHQTVDYLKGPPWLSSIDSICGIMLNYHSQLFFNYTLINKKQIQYCKKKNLQ